MEGSLRKKKGSPNYYYDFELEREIVDYDNKGNPIYGKRNRKSRSTGCEKITDAKEWVKNNYKKLHGVQELDTSIHFAYALERHISNRKRELSPTTYQEYMRIVKKHIIPFFKRNIKLKDIKRTRIKSYYNYLYNDGHLNQNKGLSNNTIRKHDAILSHFFKECVEDELISKDPTRKVKIPKINKKTNKILTYEELNKLLSIIEGSTYETGIYFATMGLRRSEIVGLKWEDIDFNEDKMIIQRSRHRYKESERSSIVNQNDIVLVEHTKTFAKNHVKNSSSKRSLPIPKYLKEQLIREKKKQNLYKELLGDKYFDSSFICVKDNGVPYDPERLTENLPKFCEKIGITRVSLHGLRHTFASLQVTSDIPIAVVQKLLGHSTIKTTVDTYGHIKNKDKKEGVRKYAEKIGKLGLEDKEKIYQ